MAVALSDWQEAVSAAQEGVIPLPAAHCPLSDSAGLTVGEDVRALVSVPREARSAVDGWAVNGSGPWVICDPGIRLSAHQASRIGKGRPLPAGAKAVLVIEDSQIVLDAEGLAVVQSSGGARPGAPRNGEHVVLPGTECLAGDVLLEKGLVLTPARIALLAAAGLETVPVYPRPAIQVVQSGRVKSSAAPDGTDERDALAAMLPGTLKAMGADAVRSLRIGGSADDWLRALTEEDDGAGAPCDVVLTLGGTGAGEADHLREALSRLGVRYLVEGLLGSPARTALLGELPDGRYVLGLPGLPAEALTALSLLGGPLIGALAHRSPVKAKAVPCGVSRDAQQRPTSLVPGRSVFGMVSPCGEEGRLSAWGEATLLLAMPPHGVTMGEEILALDLPWTKAERRGEGVTRPSERPARGGSAGRDARTGRTRTRSEPVDWAAQDWDSLRAPGKNP
ncbi:molybdopterin-binding protein [Arthrobacter sp. NPDC090010]|uniref:molybdopterin-binding protein n=1 Tax=Arthrobacter sp. NPDC090010 TaxID=3363942 RepID=UPI003807A290